MLHITLKGEELHQYVVVEAGRGGTPPYRCDYLPGTFYEKYCRIILLLCKTLEGEELHQYVVIVGGGVHVPTDVDYLPGTFHEVLQDNTLVVYPGYVQLKG